MGLLHRHDLLTPHEQWEQLCHTFMYNYKTVKGLMPAMPANHTFLTATKQGRQIRSSWSTDSLSSNLAENYIQNDRSYRLWHCNTDCLEQRRQHHSPFWQWQYWMLLNLSSADRPAPLLHTPTRITNARFLDASDIYYSNRNREMLIVMLAVALQELSPQYVPAQPLHSLQPHLRIPNTHQNSLVSEPFPTLLPSSRMPYYNLTQSGKLTPWRSSADVLKTHLWMTLKK